MNPNFVISTIPRLIEAMTQPEEVWLEQSMSITFW